MPNSNLAFSGAGLPTRGGRRAPRQRVSAEALREQRESQERMRRIRLHYGQALAWKARQEGYRIIALFAGSGGGKTWYGPRHFYPIIREGMDKTYLFTEPTYRMLKRILLPVLVPFFDSFGMGRMHYGDMLYELRGGGRILFGSVDNPNSLQGAHIDGGIWADEIGLYAEEAWDVLMQRAALYKAPILATSTPYTLPWVEQRLAKPATEKGTAHIYRCIHFPSIWNPGYPADEYFRLKRTWPADKFRRLMEGLFTRVGGLAFESYEDERHLATIYRVASPDGDSRPTIRIKHPIFYPTGRDVVLARCWLAQDWGWSDAGVQQLWGEDDDGRLYCLEEDYDGQVPVERGTDQGADTWIARALRRADEWDVDMVACDPSRPDDIASMEAYGLPAVKAVNEQEYGFDAVNTALAPMLDGKPGLFIAQNKCPNLVRTIGSYVRQKKAGTDIYLPKAAPNQDDHSCDTFRYAVVQDRRSPDKSLLTVPATVHSVSRRGYFTQPDGSPTRRR